MEGHDTRLQQTGVLRQMEGRVGSLRSLGSRGSEKLQETWHRLSFLRILLFDVCLSLADTLTDFIQAYAIIGITDIGNLRFEGHHILGLSYVLVIWAPLPLVLVHLHLCHQLPRLDQGPKAALALLVVVLLWPLVPTFFYTSLLFTTRERARKKEWRVRVFFSSHSFETYLQAHEIRAVCSGVEAPFQLIILTYLILRWKKKDVCPLPQKTNLN